jgi:hypothetical protein
MQNPPSPAIPPLRITEVRICLRDDDRLKAFVSLTLGARLPCGPDPLVAKAALQSPAEFVQP